MTRSAWNGQLHNNKSQALRLLPKKLGHDAWDYLNGDGGMNLAGESVREIPGFSRAWPEYFRLASGS